MTYEQAVAADRILVSLSGWHKKGARARLLDWRYKVPKRYQDDYMNGFKLMDDALRTAGQCE